MSDYVSLSIYIKFSFSYLTLRDDGFSLSGLAASSVCGGDSETEAQANGLIKSHTSENSKRPLYPKLYKDNLKCSLTVKGFGPKAQVMMRTELFELEDKDGTDSLTMTGSDSTIKYGSLDPGTTFEVTASEQGELLFKFATDGSISGCGFVLSYRGKSGHRAAENAVCK